MRVAKVVRSHGWIDARLQTSGFPDPFPEPLPRHMTIGVPDPPFAWLVEAGRSTLRAVLGERSPAMHASALARGVGASGPMSVGAATLVRIGHAQGLY